MQAPVQCLSRKLALIGVDSPNLDSQCKIPLLWKKGPRCDGMAPVSEGGLLMKHVIGFTTILTVIALLAAPALAETITIRMMMGSSFTVDIPLSKTGADLKRAVATHANIPVEQQRLIYDGNEIADNQTLSAAKIEDGSRVSLVLKIGGP